MQLQDTPEQRASRIKVYLSVRTSKAGEPRWDATWRDSGGTAKMRRVGPAWVRLRPALANPYIDGATGRTTEHEPAVQEEWQKWWEPKGTTGKGTEAMRKAGAYDVPAARQRARELVVERELELQQEHDRRAAEALRSTPEHIRQMSFAQGRMTRLFATVASEWFDEASVTSAWKDTVVRDYASMLASPYNVRRARARPTKATIMRTCGARAIIDLDEKEMRALLTDIAKAEGTRTSNKYRTVLNMIFNYALREGYVDANPLKNIKPIKATKKTDLIVLDVDQVEAVARAAEPRYADMIRVAANTGLRLGELTALQWGDIRWRTENDSAMSVVRSHSGGLSSVAPKSNASRLVPVSPYVHAILRQIERSAETTRRTDLVFPSARGTYVNHSLLRRKYVAARDVVQAEHPDLPVATFHQLRHTFGTGLAAAGVPLLHIQRWMGHASITTTMRYLHWVPQDDDATTVGKALAFSSAAFTNAASEQAA